MPDGQYEWTIEVVWYHKDKPTRLRLGDADPDLKIFGPELSNENLNTLIHSFNQKQSKRLENAQKAEDQVMDENFAIKVSKEEIVLGSGNERIIFP